MSKPISEDEHRTIKKQLAVNDPVTVSIMSGRSLAVIEKIAASKDFDHYKRIVRAEHPPVKNSLGDRVAELERRADVLDEWMERKKTEEVNMLFTRPEVRS